MASTAGIIATEPSAARALTSSTTPDEVAKTLKRQREPDTPSPRSAANSSNLLASPTKSARLALASVPVPLTGAAALEDERLRREERDAIAHSGTTENPSHKALTSLMSGAVPLMSRPTDAPQQAATAPMDAATSPDSAAATVAAAAAAAAAAQDEHDETSPHSTASMGGVQVTDSPTPMDLDGRSDGASQAASHEDRSQPTSLSYPGSLHASAHMTETPHRGMSFPMPSSGQASPSSGNKKHKCPYCETEFTRHHNLKSHLLTHSQEKPYVCNECQMRFRRLHDLKRHGKLHTGEKPHVCPKCDRKFARGDALARHSKGPAGCVGGSRPSDAGLEDFPVPNFNNQKFDNTQRFDNQKFDKMLGGNEEAILEAMAAGKSQAEIDEIRRQSLPSIATPQAGGEQFNPQSRSYPPAGPRASTGGLFPPNSNKNQSQGSVGTSIGSTQTPTTSASSAPMSGFPPGSGMTESPKPLSPGMQSQDGTARQRSPSMAQQFVRGQSNRNRAPGLSHPGLAGQTGTSDSNNLFAQADANVWSYIQSLQEEVKRLTGTIDTLSREMSGLKQQVATLTEVGSGAEMTQEQA